MKQLLSAVVLTTALVPIASADGIPPSYKAPVVYKPFSWTGFYAGLNAGAAWGESDVDLTASPTFFGPGGGAGGGGPDGPATLDRDGSPNLHGRAFTAGGQAGYNWQTGILVLGVEGDLNSVLFTSSGDSGVRPTPPLSPGIGTYHFSESLSTDWLATLRGRIGYSMDHTLIYATGGAAWANIDFTQMSGPFIGCGGCSVTTSTSSTKSGWAVGGGLEYAFTNNWTLKGEYLHVDLGSVSFADNLAAGGFPAASFTHSATLTEDLARVGINYKIPGLTIF
jgi:outer membrane immunogenic protein